MGSAASKSSSSARRLPVQNAAKRLQQQKPSTSSPSPVSVHPGKLPSSVKSDEILKDAQDPHFSSMLRSLGTVSHGNAPTDPIPSNFPPPFRPPPSATKFRHPPELSPTLLIVKSRETQGEHMALNPQEYLDIFRIRDVVMMREGINLNGGGEKRKMRDDEIERRLGLKPGILGKLGKRVGHTGVQIREDEEDQPKEGEPRVEFVTAV